jgi:hypothetical protein
LAPAAVAAAVAPETVDRNVTAAVVAAVVLMNLKYIQLQILHQRPMQLLEVLDLRALERPAQLPLEVTVALAEIAVFLAPRLRVLVLELYMLKHMAAAVVVAATKLVQPAAVAAAVVVPGLPVQPLLIPATQALRVVGLPVEPLTPVYLVAQVPVAVHPIRQQ